MADTEETQVEVLGDAALVVRTAQAAALRESLLRAPLSGVLEAVPALHVLTVLFDPLVVSPAALHAALAGRLATLEALAERTGREVGIPVSFGGPDLAWCAEHAGLNVTAFVEAVCAVTLEVAFLGFTPGFAFLTGLPAPLQMPRLGTPREQVPAGSVALGGPWAGVYPQASPGGWRLIGQTTAPLFDLSRPEPVLWAPGDRVRFVSVNT